MKEMNSKIFKPSTHRILYILLLIATPFLLLQNYLQTFIGQMSALTYSVGGMDIPVTLTIAVAMIGVILCISYKKINRFRAISWLVVIFLFWIGQNSTDYYFNHKFYELQFNWHYFAYAIFAYINYRALSFKKSTPEKIIKLTFALALGVSTLDELAQVPLSNRIFDLGDIAKDLWGAMIGVFIIYFILENGSIVKNGWKLRQRTIIEYTKNPLSLLFVLFILSLLFMVIASLLTETTLILPAVLITLLLFGAVFVIIHLTQFKLWRNLILAIFALLFVIQAYSFSTHFNDNIVSTSKFILNYKGIPIIFFDVMIFPDGMFRLVDKKTEFNQRDQQTIIQKCQNIVIFGTGSEGEGGKGFPFSEETQFILNELNKKGVQIILQNNKAACATYNRIKKEGKRPALIYHNN
jgi:VanZ family protein